jgi:signal transduction histidine kinase
LYVNLLIKVQFHRITGVVGRSYEGAGLGLALSMELVKLHNGNIHVASIVGEGMLAIIFLNIYSKATKNKKGRGKQQKR